MEFSTFVKESKPLIEKNILNYLNTQPILTSVSPWGEDFRERIKAIAAQGKMIRGILVLLGYRMFGGADEKALPLASALELFHTSLLIHDDIMDQDELRRGQKTLYKQYQDLAKNRGLTNSSRTGESLGICAGDLGFFLGFDLLSTVDATPDIKQKLQRSISHELTLVGLGQIQDVALGASTATPTEEEILNVYRFKTARYTFSLPLMIGAMLAGADEKQLNTIEKAGETLGIIFQIKDDELGIFGNEKQTGKPVGSDLREGKKTLYYLYLSQIPDPTAQHKLAAILGNKNIGDNEIAFIQQIITEHHINDKIIAYVERLSKKYTAEYESLLIHDNDKKIFQELLDYTTGRSS